MSGPASMTGAGRHVAAMHSRDHRANIWPPSCPSVGLGVADANGPVWATENGGG